MASALSSNTIDSVIVEVTDKCIVVIVNIHIARPFHIIFILIYNVGLNSYLRYNECSKIGHKQLCSTSAYGNTVRFYKWARTLPIRSDSISQIASQVINLDLSISSIGWATVTYYKY